MADNTDPTLPRWSSVSGAVEPSSGNKDSGFTPGYKPPAQWFNWLLRQCYYWINFFRTLLLGTLELNGNAHCLALVAPGVAWTITVGAIRTYWAASGVRTDLATQTVTLAPSIVDAGDLKTGTGPVYALYAGATYYLYLYRDSGSGDIAWNVSRTAPSLTSPGWKEGFVGTHRYVLSFKTTTQTDGAFTGNIGVPIPFYKTKQRYNYLVDATTLAHLSTATVAVAGATTISLATWLPQGVNCRNVRYLVDWDSTSGADLFNIRAVPWQYIGPAVADRRIFLVDTVATGSNQDTIAGFGTGTGNFYLVILGYEEAVA